MKTFKNGFEFFLNYNEEKNTMWISMYLYT